MTTASNERSLQAAYGEHRDALYRAVVVATGDPDLAIDAVDDAFASCGRRGTLDLPSLFTATATAVTARRIQPSANHPRLTDAAAVEQLAAFRRLDLPTRLVVAAATTADLDVDTGARALGVDPSQVRPHLPDGTGNDPVWDRLPEVARSVGTPLPRLDRVAGDIRRRRLMRWVGAFGVAVAVTAGVWSVVSLATAGDESVEASATTVPTSDGPTVLTLSWEESGLPFEQGELSSVTATDDGFVAVGQDWNDPRGQSLRLLRTETGFDWELEDLPAVGRNGGWAQQLTSVDGVVYGLLSETTPDGNEEPSLLIGKDGDWTAMPIDTDDEISIDGDIIEVATHFSTLVVDGGRFTAMGTMSPTQDLFPLIVDSLPEGVNDNGGWNIQADGIEIFGMNGEVVFSATAEELDLPQELFELTSSGKPVVWTSDDAGETWSRQEWATPKGLTTAYFGNMAMLDDGRVFTIVHDQFATGLWWGNVGEPLQRVELEPSMIPTTLTKFDDELYVAGQLVGGGSFIWSSSDGVKWEPVDVDLPADARIDAMRADDHGIIASGFGGEGVAPEEVTIEAGENSMVMRGDGRVAVLGPDGAILTEVWVEDIQRRPGGFIAIEHEGVEVIQIKYRDLLEQWERNVMVGDGNVAVKSVLMVSPDGLSWLQADTGLPEGFMPTSLALHDDTLIASGYDQTGSGVASVWVGTIDT